MFKIDKKVIISAIQDQVNEIWKLIKIESLRYSEMDLLGKLGIALIEYGEFFEINAFDKTVINFIINKIEDKLYYDNNIFYYISFYKLPSVVYDGNIDELQSLFFKINADITSMRIRIYASKIFSFAMSSSEDEYFFKRVNSGLLRGLKNLFNYLDKEVYSPAIYSLLNCHQALYEYLQINDTHNKNIALSTYKECFELLVELYKDDNIKNIIDSNIQLYYFYKHQMFIHTGRNEDIYLNFKFNSGIGIKELWALLSLYYLDINKFNDLVSKIIDELLENYQMEKIQNKILIMRIITRFLFINNMNKIDGDLALRVEEDESKLKYDLSKFFRNIEAIEDIEVTNEDIELLLNYDDNKLREKISKILINLDKNTIRRQFNKPHGPFEISDFEIPFWIDGDCYYLCMPFKSGKEISGPTVNEKIAYQIFKPFSYFGNRCIVVFITAKRCSQYLENYIQRMRSMYKWNIHIIQEYQLAALLKLNNQLN